MTALQDLLHTAAMDSVHMKLVILELNAKIVNNVRKKTKTTSTAAIMCVLRVRNYVILERNLKNLLRMSNILQNQPNFIREEAEVNFRFYPFLIRFN